MRQYEPLADCQFVECRIELAFEARCQDLGVEGLIHVWLWQPSEEAVTDGFNFKWMATAFSGITLTDFLGFHPDVEAEIALHRMEMEVKREVYAATTRR